MAVPNIPTSPTSSLTLDRVSVLTRRPVPSSLTRKRALTLATAGVLVAGLGVGPSVADDGAGGGRSADAKGLGSGSPSTYRGRNPTSDGKPRTVVGPPAAPPRRPTASPAPWSARR